MMDLLKNKKYTPDIAENGLKKGLRADIENTGNNPELTESEKLRDGEMNKKVDLGRYSDPEGLTIKKLNVGLWLVKNRRNISLLFHSFLIMVSIIAWSIFVLNFGMYVVSGMNKDQAMIDGLVQENLFGREYLESVSADDIKYGQVQSIKTLDGKYDIFTNIENVNTKHLLEFDYYFMVGNERIQGETSFILPRQSKYLLSLNKNIPGSARSISFHLENLNWKRINLHKYPDWEDFRNKRLAISTSDIKFVPASANKVSEKLELNNLEFKTTNSTAFNYRDVNFVILLYSSGRIVGVTKYIVSNLRSEQTQGVNLVWPGKLERVNDIVIYPEVNIVDDDVYLDFDGGIGESK